MLSIGPSKESIIEEEFEKVFDVEASELLRTHRCPNKQSCRRARFLGRQPYESCGIPELIPLNPSSLAPSLEDIL